MKQQILEEIASFKHLKDDAYKWCSGNDIHNDLYQSVMLQMAEKTEAELLAIKNLRHYVSRVLWLNATSKSAPFLRLQENYEELKIDLPDNRDCKGEEVLALAEEFFERERKKYEFNGDKAWNIELLKLYIQEGSFGKVEKLTGIKRLTVHYNIKGLIKQLNEYITNNI